MKEGWTLTTIGDVCQIVNGGTPKSGVAEYWNGTHLWITPAEMGKRSDPHVDDTERKISELGLRNSSARMLPPNSVILSSRAPIGHLVINAKPMATNQGCKGLVPSAGLDHKFLFYYLLSIVELLESLGTGATFKELSGGKLKGVPIPLPSLTEQQRIARLLDDAFASLIVAKSHLESNLQSSRELFQSHAEAVFGQRGDDWSTVPLGDLCEILDSLRRPITKRDREPGDVPYYGATGVQDRVKGFIFDEPLVLVGEDGAKWRSHERTAYAISGRSWVNNHAHVLRPDRRRVRDDWLIYFLNARDLSEFVSGLTVPKLNQANLRTIPILLPPIDCQTRLVFKMERIDAETRQLASVYRRKLSAFDQLKRSLLHQAFSGQL